MKQPKNVWIRDLDDDIEFHDVNDIPWWVAVAGLLGLLSIGALLGGLIFLMARLAV